MADGRESPLLTEEQLERYSRHVRLSEVGVEGQRRLLDAKVVVVGAGGLGSPALLYLAAAGVGTLGVVDGDRVDLSNLQRQVIHFNHDLGRWKTQSARRTIEDTNPDVTVVEHRLVLTRENALEVLAPYNVVINGSDNFPTRYLVNDACVMLGKPLVDAAILRWEGMAAVYVPGKGCYRCVFPEPPPPGSVPSCAEAGILGAVAGHLGTLQAIEAIKLILGLPSELQDHLLIYDAITPEYRLVARKRDPACPVCGENPSITELIDYEEFCGVPGRSHGEPAPMPAPSLTGAPAAPGGAAGDGGRVAAPEEAPAIGPEEVERLLAEGAQLVDVREPHEYRQSRIPGSVLIPLGRLPTRLSEIDRSRPVVVVCAVGERSAQAVELLRALGHSRAYNLRGGIVAWANLRKPLESG